MFISPSALGAAGFPRRKLVHHVGRWRGTLLSRVPFPARLSLGDEGIQVTVFWGSEILYKTPVPLTAEQERVLTSALLYFFTSSSSVIDETCIC